jgi:EAL domain-containing protein (putative c-di-GMP-specific phosphodiesterase class I)
VPIGRWVLRQACLQAQTWNSPLDRDVPLVMSVNLSVRQFQDPGLLSDIEHILLETGLDPRLLKLEITESIAINDADATLLTLHALKAAGIRLAIDDFGTGYSWLGYLTRFPVDALKIDRSFVQHICEDTHDAAIVQSVVALARTLNLTVVGEGIESREQAAQLRLLGCDDGQGFLYARPEPAETITALLNQPAADLAA